MFLQPFCYFIYGFMGKIYEYFSLFLFMTTRDLTGNNKVLPNSTYKGCGTIVPHPLAFISLALRARVCGGRGVPPFAILPYSFRASHHLRLLSLLSDQSEVACVGLLYLLDLDLVPVVGRRHQ